MKKLVVAMAVMVGLAGSAMADLINAGFEIGYAGQTNPVGWEDTSDGGTWGQADIQNWRFYSGTNEGSMHAWGAEGADAGWWQELTNISGGGVVWEASAWFGNDNGTWGGGTYTNTSSHLKIEFYSGTYGAPLSVVTNSFALPGESWTRYSVQGTAPVDTAWARFVVAANGQGTSGALQFDDTSLVVIPEPTAAALLSFGALLFLAIRRGVRK